MRQWQRREDFRAGLHFTGSEDSVEFTVPAGGVRLIVKGGVVTRPRESGLPGPRYFELVDRSRHVQISGWLEASNQYAELQRFRKQDG